MSWRGHGVLPLPDDPDGRWLSVPGVEVGERVRVRMDADARSGRLLEVIEPAATRVDPGCAQALGCPGCPLRHLDVPRRAAIKHAAHRGALTRLGGVDPLPPTRVITAAPTDGYRARARARPVAQGDAVVLGMPAHPGHAPIELDACPAQTPGTRALLQLARRVIEAAGVPWSLEPDAPGVRSVEVEGAPEDGRISLLISATEWDAALTAGVAGHPGVQLTRSVLGARGPGPWQALHGPTAAHWRCEDDTFRVTAPAWRPHSPFSVPALRRLVIELLDPQADDDLLEIGCGVGTSSLPLARRARTLLGIDMQRAAIIDATANAASAGVANARFQVGEADHAVRRLLGRGRRFDRILLHLMRRPLGGATLRRLTLLGAQRLVYITPSVASLARDLADRGAWQIDEVVFLDQLPGTVHLLCVCVLSRVPEAR